MHNTAGQVGMVIGNTSGKRARRLVPRRLRTLQMHMFKVIGFSGSGFREPLPPLPPRRRMVVNSTLTFRRHGFQVSRDFNLLMLLRHLELRWQVGPKSACKPNQQALLRHLEHCCGPPRFLNSVSPQGHLNKGTGARGVLGCIETAHAMDLGCVCTPNVRFDADL
jgi:hypothetical protein